jgi:hypothetical protein
MSTVVDESSNGQSTSPTERLRTAMAAMRVSIRWLGIRKSLTSDQKSVAADVFGAEGAFLSAGKKLLDNRHPAFKAVTAVRNRAISYAKSVSLPYPEPGVRLLRQDRIDQFDVQMREFRDELDEAVRKLDNHYAELRRAARERLGTLYDPSNYPDSLIDMFSMEWEFPAIEPPDYLRQLNPQLYEQECQRVQARFDDAVRLAEEAFTGELAKIVSHLTERLSGHVDGQPKVFRDSAVGNLTEFFERFRDLNVRSNEELDRLVVDAQRIVRGIGPQDLRDNQDLRQHVATKLSGVQSVLDGLLVDRPRRRILRKPR